MLPEERDPAYLWDMLEALRAVEEYVGDLSLEAFLADDRNSQIIRMAVERKLEVAGEAARKVSLRFREAHTEIPWKEIVGLRNVISHEYNRVSYPEIYRIIREQVPKVIALLEPLVPPPPAWEE